MKMPAWPKARHRPGAPDASRGDVWWRGAGEVGGPALRAGPCQTPGEAGSHWLTERL